MMRNQCQIIVLAVLIITIGGSYDHRCSRTEAFSMMPTTVETRPCTKQIIRTSTKTECSPPLYQQEGSLFTDLPSTTQQEQEQISGSSISATTNYLESLARRTTAAPAPQSSHGLDLKIDDDTDSTTTITIPAAITRQSFPLEEINDDYDDDDAQSRKQQQTTNGTTSKEAIMKEIREAGMAGIISFGLVQLGFWGLSIPIVIGGYYQMTGGHWPDWNNVDDIKALGAESFAFVNIARIAAPFRIAVALGAIPFFQENIVNRFAKGKETVEDGGGK